MFSLFVFLITFVPVLTETINESSWILVADSSIEHSWWHKSMPMKGLQVLWELVQNDDTKILKIHMFESTSSKKYCQIIAQINQTSNFDHNNYEVNISPRITLYDGGRQIKAWSNQTQYLSLMVNNGEATLRGQNFYFWFRVGERYSINYTILLILAAILIIKTEVTFQIRGRFSGPQYVIPGILIYFVLFPKGILNSVSDLCFQNSWIYGHVAAYSLAAYIWFPYVVRIFGLFYTLPSLRQNDNFWKSITIGILGSSLSSYGIFWDLNEISLLIVFAIELSLTKTIHLQHFKKGSVTLKYIYILDLVILIYLLIWPVYPSKHILVKPIWLFGAFLLVLCQMVTYFFRKQIPVQSVKRSNSPRKNNSKNQ